MDAPLAIRIARVFRAALALVPLALPLASAVPAQALAPAPYTLEVLVDGQPLAELYGHGRRYVEAFAGREYSLRLTNHTGRRVGIAVSVDGLNSIDARTTTAQAGSKWILGPYESIVLDGWQTSSALARHFYFTSEKSSYGAWLGKTANLGVIAAVVFRERLPETDQPMRFRERGKAAIPESRAEGGMPGEAPSAAAPAPAAPGRADTGAGALSGGFQAPPSDDYAATGIGREVDHQIERVRFEAERSAAACLEIRYEYRPALVKLGLLPRVRPSDPLERRERAHGFEPGFAPDPYRPDGGR
jgi:hypothetical protein